MGERPDIGTLYVLATPIGNLEDITRRAVRILAEVSFVVAEDTRHTLKLLSALGISRPLVSCHAHTRPAAIEGLVRRLAGGESAALATDAGTPGVSDPGSALVRACRAAAVPVIPVPGPAACTALLSVSGFPASRVFFTGFLPLRTARRRDLLARAALAAEAIVCYENPHRVRTLLEDISAVFGPEAEVLIGREMTKIHEEYPLAAAAAFAAAPPLPKGEYTVAVRVPPDWNVSFKFGPSAADTLKRRRKESRHEYREG